MHSQTPWQQHPADSIPNPPSMLGDEERQFLYYVASQCFQAEGDIVDAGAFLGGSAAALAAGLRNNAHVAARQRRIYSYDFFEYDDYHQGYIPQFNLQKGEDTLGVFRHFTNEYTDLIVPVKGDICQQNWTGGPIEILFVDFTQNWNHHAFVVRNFYRHMVPGKSILIHQDYLYTVCYWLHLFMEHYQDYFQVVSRQILNSSAAWMLTRPLPEEVYQHELNNRLGADAMLELFDRSIARYEGLQAALLKCARVRLLREIRGHEPAVEYAKFVVHEYRNSVPMLPHLTALLDELGCPSSLPPLRPVALWPRSKAALRRRAGKFLRHAKALLRAS